MAKAFITEFGARRKDSNGRTLPYPNHPPLASQAVSISDTSAQSAAFAEHTRFIRISADVECAYKVGENPTATVDDAALAPDEIEYIGVKGGDKVALVTLEAAAAGTTWNPDDLGANVALSGGNLTATKITVDTSYAGGRATSAKSSGKHSFECEVVAVNAFDNEDYAAAALATSAADLNDWLGQAVTSVAYYADGTVYKGGSVAATLAPYVAGDMIGCHWDADTGKGWFTKNGVAASGDPAAGTGEHFTFTAGAELFPAFTLYRTFGTPDALTANFGATAFAHTPPTGFSAWDA
jgi:hypothetical protein